MKGITKGDTKSLDYGSHGACAVMHRELTLEKVTPM